MSVTMGQLAQIFTETTRIGQLRLFHWEQSSTCNRARFENDHLTFLRMWAELYKTQDVQKFAKLLKAFQDFVEELPEEEEE